MRGELAGSRAKRASVLLTGALLACGLLVATASANNAGVTHYPDLQTIIPTDTFSVVQGAAGKEFRYTHLVYNQGPGPLDIMPQYNQASGSYQGMQRLWTHNAAGTWQQVSQSKVADPFIFHAPHGHFHFPLATFGLYAVNPDGSPRRACRDLAEERLLHLGLVHRLQRDRPPLRRVRGLVGRLRRSDHAARPLGRLG